LTHPAAPAATRPEPAVEPLPRAGAAASAPRWLRFPLPLLFIAAGIVSIAFLPRIRDVPTLVWTLEGAAALLLLWTALLWPIARRRGQALRIQLRPVRSHWVQASVQAVIMAYWAYAAHPVREQAPLLLAQILYFYGFDALLSWSRKRDWWLGFGPLPIVVSTNLLLWFKDDWYSYQFVMLTAGVLGKNFVTWVRDGRRTHIFNPSAFGQIVVAIVLIATATTNQMTWGREIATTFEIPHMTILIFACGLIVQSMFRVTLMTIAAAATLVGLNLAYTGMTGLYYFVNINFAATIFLGVHLLITDPATSPRSNVGRVLFGCGYGVGYFALFRVLEAFEVPLFWDKLLPVPILNLAVPLIERVSRAGWLGRLNRAWEGSLTPARLNLVHMSVWAALFGTMLATGFIDAPHPGDSIPFWKQAVAEGKQHAGQSLVLAAGAQAEGQGSGAAFNELGLICMEGKLPGVQQSDSKAAEYFAAACELGNTQGCANVAIQYLFLREQRSEPGVQQALDRLEQQCEAGTDTLACYLLASAYETGHGRPLNFSRAIEYYRRCGPDNVFGCKGLARIALRGIPHPRNPLTEVALTLKRAFEAGDAESGWYLAYMLHQGLGIVPDENAARAVLEACCTLGMKPACDAAGQSTWPDYKNPVMTVPNWATAFPAGGPSSAGP